MKEAMYRQLVDVIHDHRTWIAVHQSDQERNMMVQVAGELRTIRTRVLTLVARWQNHTYKRGHVWDITAYDLDRAVRSLKRDPRFKERWNAGRITLDDAEAIVKYASYGFLNLDLDREL